MTWGGIYHLFGWNNPKVFRPDPLAAWSWNWKRAVLYSQEQKEVELGVRGTGSGNGEKEVFCWRCQTCRRLRKSTRRLHWAAQGSWTCLWTHHRFTQNIYTQLWSNEWGIVHESITCLSSPPTINQSSDSTQIDDCQLQKSPVFPSSGCRLEVHIPRLSEDLLHACRTSGFICSQDNCFSPLWPVPAQSKSPTFPRSPKRHTELTVFSEKDKGDDGVPEHCRSNRHEKSPSRCRSPVGVRNSGLMISSQESLSPSLTSTTCRPQSPVFPRSPDPPGPSGTNEAQAVQSPGHRTSPVFGESGRPQHCLSARKHCLKSSAEELRGPRREEVRTAAEDPSWSLTDVSVGLTCSKPKVSEDEFIVNWHHIN